jgi:hypothetical protein
MPLADKKLPTFRSTLADNHHPPEVWWLWDWAAEREWRVDRLSEEQRRFPLLEVWNDTLLKKRIVEGWKPEDSLW